MCGHCGRGVRFAQVPDEVSRLSPSTPVIVGVGQASERIDQPGYRALSAADLAAEAVRAAVADTSADAAQVIAALDTVAAVRAFDDSHPLARAELGAPDNVARAVAARVGARPHRAILGPTGGQSPQRLVNELCDDIAAGICEAAVLTGAEVIATVRSLSGRARSERRDFAEHAPGSLEDRGYGVEGMTPAQAVLHHMTEAAVLYTVLENARRARLGASRPEYARAMGELFSPLSAVAAGNPHAAAPVAYDAGELIRVGDRNRHITDAYTRLLVARDQVNQGAADPVAAIGRPDGLLDTLIAHRDPVEGLAALREQRVPHWRST